MLILAGRGMLVLVFVRELSPARNAEVDDMMGMACWQKWCCWCIASHSIIIQ